MMNERPKSDQVGSNRPDLMDDYDPGPPRSDNPVNIKDPEYITQAVARQKAGRGPAVPK